jgi:hypothetical protein
MSAPGSPAGLGRPLLGAALVASVLARPATAAAYHDETEHLVDDTAWTLQGEKNWRLGFFRLDFAPLDRLTLGTYHWLWLGRVANLNAKWRFYAGDAWQWSARASFFRLDTAHLDPKAENPPVFTLGTLELLSSVALGRSQQLSQGLVYTVVRVKGGKHVSAPSCTGDGSAIASTTKRMHSAFRVCLFARTVSPLADR